MPKHAVDLAIVMGNHHPGEEEDAPDSETEMSPDDHKASMHDAAMEVFDAFKKGDREAFADALEAFCDLHQTKPDEDEEPEGDEDDEAEAENEDDGHNGIHYP